MLVRSATFWATTLGAIWLVASVSGAHALTMKECSAKYKAAQDSGTLKGMKWNDFRKAECGTGASALPTSAPAAGATPAAAPPANSSCRGSRHPSSRDPCALGRRRRVPVRCLLEIFGQVAGKARMHTCLDQYNANKTGNGNGGLKWIEKGGGYYSECNKRLKG